MSELTLAPSGASTGGTPEPGITPAPETPADETVAAPVEGSTETPPEDTPVDGNTSLVESLADDKESVASLVETSEVSDNSEPATADEETPVDSVQAQGGFLNLKPDSSPQALEQLYLKGEHITDHLLDEVEKRCDVSDVKFLVAFCRRALAAIEGKS